MFNRVLACSVAIMVTWALVVLGTVLIGALVYSHQWGLLFGLEVDLILTCILSVFLALGSIKAGKLVYNLIER